ncbi:peptidylprolyl isomerase [Candidatus Woesearchaeota archaeon]|nr:peptidylprolyl isomerase [Candidatus Woesearchaeota archaeon]
MNVKIKDFIEIEYTGKLKAEDIIFDTTDEKLAKENNIHQENSNYGPTIICLGENQILKGLDDQLIGKETEKEHTIELAPENAFGKKDAKLMQLIPTSKFSQQNIRPVPGLRLNIDGLLGTIKTASGGRNLVDFNHPFAGKDIIYKVKINKLVTDDKEKVKAYLEVSLNLKDLSLNIENSKANITLKKEFPKEVSEELSKKITELIPNIKKVEFTVEGVKK